MPVPKGKQARYQRGGAEPAFWRGIINLTLFVVLAIGLATFLLWADRPELGPDLCPKDSAFRPPKIIVLVFDQTDRLTMQHQAWLESYYRRLLHDEFESTEAQEKWRFTRFEVFSFRTKGDAADLDLRRDLAVCNPGGVTGLTKYTDNPEIVRRNFEEKFLDRINSELRQLLEFRDSPRSPIFEALKEIGFKTFTDPKYEGSEKILIVASDLLHNTTQLSLRKMQPTFDEFYRTSYGNRLVADLKATEVRLLVFAGDAEQAQRVATERLWLPYFRAAGAKCRVVKMVPSAEVDRHACE